MNTTEEEEHSINPDVSSFSLSDCTSQEALKKYRVADLKALLQARGLSKEGRKDDLVKRLWEWAQAEEALKMADEDFDVTQVKKVEAVKGQPEPVSKTTTPIVEAPKQEIKKATTSAIPKQEITQPSVTKPSTKPSVTKAGSGNNLPDEKMQARTDRFGPVETADSKLKARAERFGIVDEKVKKQQRQERFGNTLSPKSHPVMDEETLKKMKERQARFGETTSKFLLKSEEQEAKKRRLEKFGN